MTSGGELGSAGRSSPTERARDGDYALNDLAALRANPFHAARDYEGFTHRDIVAPTILVRRTGTTVDFSSTTGFVWWKTDDSTDLDYTPLPLASRDNDEEDLQFTQEVRFVVGEGCARSRSPTSVTLDWQAACSSSRRTTNRTPSTAIRRSCCRRSSTFPSSSTRRSRRSTTAVSAATAAERSRSGTSSKSTVGLRGDYENKQAL